MRRLLAALLLAGLAALSGCAVETEGAPCTSRDNCPAGQGCGADGRCGARALQCVACPAGARRCEPGGAAACQVAPDGVCTSWAVSACAEGAVCGDATAVCQPKYGAALAAPAAGALVGPSGAAVTAVVTLATADEGVVPVPDTVALLADGAPVATLDRVATSGLTATYQGTYLPPAAKDGPVQLQAQLGSGVDLATSPAVAVAADTIAPVAGDLTISCSRSPCPRDGVLTVTVQASDTHLAAVSVALDLDPTISVALSNGGAGSLYSAQLTLKGWPFPFFAHQATATVTATDGAGNSSSLVGAASLTRLRWTYSAGATVTSPAVLADGTLVVGVAASSNQLRAVGADGTERWRLTLQAGSSGGQPVRVAPSAGNFVWAASDDGNLYAATVGGALIGTCQGTAAGSLFTPSVAPGSKEVAYAGSSNGEVIAAETDGSGIDARDCNRNGTTDPVTAASALADGVVLVPTAVTSTNASLRQFTRANPVVLASQGSAPLTSQAQVPLAQLASGKFVVATSGGDLYQSDPTAGSANATSFFKLDQAFAFASPVVSGTGDVFVPGSDKRVHRVTVPTSAASSDLWSASSQLPATPNGLALVTPDRSGVFLLATSSTTAGGSVIALKEVGGLPSRVWPGASEAPLSSGGLSFPVVAPPPPDAPASQLPSLYVGSSEGKVYAVVVDTPLDPTSPWPKSHRDLRNTGNAAAPLP